MAGEKNRRVKQTTSSRTPEEPPSDAKSAGVLESITESWLKASKNGDVETLKSLRASGMDINQTNKYGEMAVHYAAALGQMAVLEWLYAHGASFRHGNDMGATPLHMAVSHSRDDVVLFMLERGVDPNLQTKRGATALHIASATSDVNLVKLLVAAGADPRARTFDGQTPIDYAMKSKNNETVVFLEASALAGVDPAANDDVAVSQSSSSGVATHGKGRLEAIQKHASHDDSGRAASAAASPASGTAGGSSNSTSRSMGTSESGLPPPATEEVPAAAEPSKPTPLRIDVSTGDNSGPGSIDSAITAANGSMVSSPPPKPSPQVVANALNASKLNDGPSNASTTTVTRRSMMVSQSQPSSSAPAPQAPAPAAAFDGSEPRRNPLVDMAAAAFAAPNKPTVNANVPGTQDFFAGAGPNSSTNGSTARPARLYPSFVPLAEAPMLEDYAYKFVTGKSGARPNFSDPRNWRRVVLRLVQNLLLVFKNERDAKPSSIICLEDAFIRNSSLEIGVMYTFAVTHFKSPGGMSAFGPSMGSGVLDEHFFQTCGTNDVESWVKFLSQSMRSNVKSLVETSREADLSTRDELETASQALRSIQQENELCLQEALAREAPIGEEKRTVEKMRGHLGASAKARNAIGVVPWDVISAASVSVEMALKKVEQKRRMLLLAAGVARKPGQASASATTSGSQPPDGSAAGPLSFSHAAHVAGAVDAFAKAGRARRGTFAPSNMKHITDQLTDAEKQQDAVQLSMEQQDVYQRRQHEAFKQQSKTYMIYYGSADDESNLVGEMDIHENETVLGLRRQLARELKIKLNSFALRFGDTATLGPGEQREVQAISVDPNGPIIVLPMQ